MTSTYFPPYEAVFVVRKDATEFQSTSEHRRLGATVISLLAGAISTDEMRKLNYEVDGARRDPKVVVREWLVKKGFIQP
jgi:glycine betaine/choline ABC-type transport system substrate-binding protein